MRRTLTIDEDNAVRLERLRKRRNARFEEIVNEAIRNGLDRLEAVAPKRRKPFRTRAVDLGPLQHPSIEDALRAMEDEYDRKKRPTLADILIAIPKGG